MTRTELFTHITDHYVITPDYPFEGDPVTAVFRHGSNRKWFAIAMSIPRAKLGLSGEGHLDVVNLKVSPEMLPALWQEAGVYPAYHMNKKHWVTVTLDEKTSDELTVFLTGVSYDLTAPGLRKKQP